MSIKFAFKNVRRLTIRDSKCYNSVMFENLHFNGKFRTYQQKILDGADVYLQDGHIHIVAAPGSGKTILGLELIKRLAQPCIILSPTTTIRNQWTERFTDNFLDGETAEKFISVDLTRLAPLTSVTYQALYAAMKRIKDSESDYSSFDLIAEIKRYGIKTLCLDEAHHLQNEWQKALENFIAALNGEVKIIALTATPPYDAKPNEWKRYVGVCGEIDEEIFVPELVKQGTLCPHQDYLYFNYPTAEETADFKAYRERCDEAIDELISSKLISKAYGRLTERKEDYDYLYTNTSDIIAFISLCSATGMTVDKKLVKTLTSTKRLPRLTKKIITVAVNFLIKGTLLTEEERELCFDIFKRHSVTEHGEVALELNEDLKRKLISSLGKLDSIAEIAKSEYENKKEALRLLILTDYIKKESVSIIGSEKKPDTISVVSNFETVRKTGIKIGALSGSLIILPDSCAEKLKGRTAFTKTPLKNTGYSQYEFSADNREKVKLISELFENGEINALVGTKSLLGEGWDAPCVNSLILSSFVGSFMLSNQMRGRAIRTDKNQPDKTANIWHIVTVERPHLYADGLGEKISLLLEENKNELVSYDFDTVSKRFDCFVAPNYTTGEIESGISRVTIIKPPYDEKRIAKINSEMIARSREGEKLKTVWKEQVDSCSAQLNDITEIPKENKTPPFIFLNIATATALLSIFTAFFSVFIANIAKSSSIEIILRSPITYLALIACTIIVYFLLQLIIWKILKHINPTRSIRTLATTILEAMQEVNIISKGAHVKVEANNEGTVIKTELLNASVHDQNIFHNAIKELLSPIENPRYILIPRGIFNSRRFNCALACPEALGVKSEYAKCLAAKLKRTIGKIDTVYTRTEQGRKLILKCRKFSYITYNDSLINGTRKHISRWE